MHHPSRDIFLVNMVIPVSPYGVRLVSAASHCFQVDKTLMMSMTKCTKPSSIVPTTSSNGKAAPTGLSALQVVREITLAMQIVELSTDLLPC
mmetsp:Transcript_46769/g.113993  ORF Transcript_46769/g.113993 Transcript_46769/m.113993 type:complete len:92 (+) Transcript_46769:387-662(+)